MGAIWWEKTVEYRFVLESSKKEMFLAPLDGKHEKAGDTIFASDGKWILIEFKRDEESIKNEKNKFNSYEKAQQSMKNNDDHHFIVYGKYENNQLILESRTYFSEKQLEKIDEMYERGIEISKFLNYIKKFNSYKKSDSTDSTDSTDSNSSSGTSNYSNVVGVNSNGDIVMSGTVEQFQSEYAQYESGEGQAKQIKQELKAPKYSKLK